MLRIGRLVAGSEDPVVQPPCPASVAVSAYTRSPDVIELTPHRPGDGPAGRGVSPRERGHGEHMTVTDPDIPDPLNAPRTLQADPGAVAQGEDLASTEDDPVATGEDELQAGRTEADDAGGGDGPGGAASP